MPQGNDDIICIVDDDTSILKSLVGVLRTAGLETVPFDDPRLFLEYVKDHSVSVAIIDLRMPGFGCMEVQRRLFDIAPEIAVFTITGDESVADKKVTLVQGPIDLFLNPLLRAGLLDEVRKTIQLEPCPFCGKSLLEVKQTNGLQYAKVLPVVPETSPEFFWVLCRLCNSGGPLANSKREARLLWNRRASKGRW